MNKIISELFEQVNNIERQIENLEEFKEELFKRIDTELEKEGGI